jgi:glutamate dehydrogenase/leucine dehydrogenase
LEVMQRSADSGSGGRPRRRSTTSEWTRYAAFLRRPPELSVAWSDPRSTARGWLVINSSRGGAAGGGTRMRSGLRAREVTYLAKAMELKFALSGPPIGGAKSGIAFDPSDPRRLQVLERFYRSISPFLHDRYGTGGDLNVDEALDVIPTFRRIGLEHPQEGVVRGHYRPDAAAYLDILDRLERGVVAPLTGDRALDGIDFTVSDAITGFGVARAVQRYYERCDRDITGARIIMEGFGNVGASCAVYLARAGARIVAIRDARSVLRSDDGLDADHVEDLIRRRSNKLLPPDDPRVESPDRTEFIADADVFVCAAISESIQPATLDVLEARGIGIIACGANQPFREAKLGSTRVAQQADRRFTILADILSNCGMARALSHLMETTAGVDAQRTFAAVDATITDSLDEVLDRCGNRRTSLLAATVGLALDRVEEQLPG